jgi:hypothetical protein
LVGVERSNPVSLFEIFTFAPAITAADLSVTVPVSVAVELSCPKKLLQTAKNSRVVKALCRQNLYIEFFLTPEFARDEAARYSAKSDLTV